MRNEIPITELGLPDKVQAGISYPNTHIGNLSIVPEIEAREAAIYCHYNYTQFVELPVSEQAASIAQYRMHFLIEAHVQQASQSASEAEAGRASRAGRRR